MQTRDRKNFPKQPTAGSPDRPESWFPPVAIATTALTGLSYTGGRYRSFAHVESLWGSLTLVHLAAGVQIVGFLIRDQLVLRGLMGCGFAVNVQSGG